MAKKKKNSIFKKIADKFSKFGQGFVLVSKIIMLIVCIGTGILSIYYTGTYMSGIIDSVFVAYLVSSTMYAYGLIGLNYAGIFKEQKKYFLSFVFAATAFCTICFSMGTSLMVNGEKYYTNKVSVEQQMISENSSNQYQHDLLERELARNEEQIESLLKQKISLNEDIKFQQTQWSMIWDNESGGYKVIEGRVSATAQEAILKDKEDISSIDIKISELEDRNTEISKELISLTSTTTVLTQENNIETFTQMISRYLNIDANYIQLFMILFCSVFIDIISPLALMIAKNKETPITEQIKDKAKEISEDFKAKLNDAENALKQIKNELDKEIKLNLEKDTIIEKLSDPAASIASEIEMPIVSNNEELEETNKKLEEANKKLEEAKKELKDKKYTEEDLKVLLNKASTVSKKKIEKLTKDVNAWNKNYEDVCEEVDQLKRENRGLKDKLCQYQTEEDIDKALNGEITNNEIDNALKDAANNEEVIERFNKPERKVRIEV